MRVIHQKNTGHGGAVMAGLGAARGEYVFLIDSDRQIPLDDFPKAWREIAAGVTRCSACAAGATIPRCACT